MTRITYNRRQVEDFLKEHILRGDRGDGIPNFLSEDDVLVKGIRQSPIREIKLLTWIKQEPEEFCDDNAMRRYRRNEALVDLHRIPEEIEQSILAEWEAPNNTSRSKIFAYLVKNKMKNLLDCVHEF